MLPPPAAFYQPLRNGDTLPVTRKDGATVRFSIDAVTDCGKNTFPDDEVYGNTEGREIRLITCCGDFDEQTDHYEVNIVATRKLVWND